MKIQSSIATILVFFLIVCAVSIAGCTNKISNGNQSGIPQGKGISDITPQLNLKNISLESSIEALNSTDIPGSNITDRLSIFYIRGGTVDFNGMAKNWAIGGKRGQATFFFIHDSASNQLSNWTGALPEREIDLTKIIMPEVFMQQRRLLIQDMTSGGNVPVTELELQDGQYIVTVRYDSELKIRRFDAINGESIE